MDAIRTEGLTRRFGGTAAVDGLTLSIERGEIFGLVGPDGAGKTNDDAASRGDPRPDGGDAWILGHSVRGETAEVHRRIGYMSQRFGLYADLTVLENLHFYADLYGVPAATARPASTAVRLQRPGAVPAPPRGEPVRRDEAETGALVRPRAHPRGSPAGRAHQRCGPRLPARFLADPPPSPREGVTIFVATAYLDEASLCRRVGLLHQGKFLAVGSPEEVRSLFRACFWRSGAGTREGLRRSSGRRSPPPPSASSGLCHLGTRDPVLPVAAARNGPRRRRGSLRIRAPIPLPWRTSSSRSSARAGEGGRDVPGEPPSRART